MKLIRVGQVAEKCACSVPKVWEEVASNPAFPRPVKPSPGITAWVESEVDSYLRGIVERYRAAPAKNRASTQVAANASLKKREEAKNALVA